MSVFRIGLVVHVPWEPLRTAKIGQHGEANAEAGRRKQPVMFDFVVWATIAGAEVVTNN